MEYHGNTKTVLAHDLSPRYRSGMGIRERREELGLSQAQLAEAVGTSQPQIDRLEKGQRKLTKEWAERLAPPLKTSAEALLFDRPTTAIAPARPAPEAGPMRSRLMEEIRRTATDATNLARAIGRGKDYVRDFLDGKKDSIGAAEAARIERHFGRPPGWLFSGDTQPITIPIAGSLPTTKGELSLVKVVGVAEAGAFRQQDMLTQVEESFIEVPESDDYPNARRYALLVRGDSMDTAGIRDGDRVIAIDYIDSWLTLQDGDIVHVQRSEGGLMEWTIKELFVFPDHYELRPNSRNPVHQAINIPRGGGEDTDLEIRIVGVVVEVLRKLRRRSPK